MHASTVFTPFYVNGLTHPRVSLTLPLRGSSFGGGGLADQPAVVSPNTVRKQVSEFLATRFSVLRHVRDAMANSQDKQKEQAGSKGRGCIVSYEVGDQVLLNVKNLPTNVVSAVFTTKLRPRFIGRSRSWPRRALLIRLTCRASCEHLPCCILAFLSRIMIFVNVYGALAPHEKGVASVGSV